MTNAKDHDRDLTRAGYRIVEVFCSDQEALYLSVTNMEYVGL